VTRVGERRGEGDGVIDIGVGVGGIEMEGRIREGGVGMDHKVLEVDVRMLGWEVVKEKREMGGELGSGEGERARGGLGWNGGRFGWEG